MLPVYDIACKYFEMPRILFFSEAKPSNTAIKVKIAKRWAGLKPPFLYNINAVPAVITVAIK